MKSVDQLKASREELQKHSLETVERLSELDLEIEKQIAEESKPKLRHGEIRYWPLASKEHYNGLWSIINLSNPENMKQMWVSGNGYSHSDTGHDTAIGDSVHVSYLVDDLKAMQEDVTEFEGTGGEGHNGGIRAYLGHDHKGTSCRRDHQNHTMLYLSGSGWFNLESLSILRLKMQQMEATLKRQAKK